jgi:uncharacterized oxidoreductase
MRFAAAKLEAFIGDVFRAAGCSAAEAECVAGHLVEANLVGHDSHGVIRTPPYLRWLKDGKVLPDRRTEVVLESDALAVVDGGFGFGQTVGRQAMELGIAKAKASGVAVIALRNAGHLGRIGAWPAMAANAGLISLHFVNTSGAGILVAPFGGIDRRLSANPIAAGIPRTGVPPILLDMSACTIAEGKIKVAHNRGVPVPPGCIIDSTGAPTTDPAKFYANPPGAILPIAGHKGYGLAVLCEVLAGALTGSGCSDPARADRLVNGMLTVILDPARFGSHASFAGEIERFIDWVKSSRFVAPGGEILMPGEFEERTRAERLRDGIELDETTRSQIAEAARSVRVDPAV